MIVWWLGCADPTETETMDTAMTSADSGDAVPTVPTVPTDPVALESWLASGEYLSWPAEPAPHPSTGPHFGQVRTFLSESLAESLEAGQDRHPLGAATVKELYGDGTSVEGYSVMVRVSEAGGDNAWFWYERFGGTTYADDRGVALCSGCHEDGVDFILTPWP